MQQTRPGADITIPTIEAGKPASGIVPEQEITIILPFDPSWLDEERIIDATTQPLTTPAPLMPFLVVAGLAMLLPIACLAVSLVLALRTPPITVTLFSKEQAIENINTI